MPVSPPTALSMRVLRKGSFENKLYILASHLHAIFDRSSIEKSST